MQLEAVLADLVRSYRERGCDASVATMTVVVFFDDGTIGELARDRIKMLASKHPSRIVVLDGTRDHTLASVESCDWIELGAQGCDPEMLRDAVGALRIADAPLVLLWIAPGIEGDARFAALCEDVQMVVYNSSLVDTGDAGLRELVGYVKNHPGLPMSDIAYLRLAPWQECVAIFFDGNAAQELHELEAIEIACGSQPEAFYLLGWLASRLQWTASGTNELTDRSGKRVSFEIRQEGPPRRIARIALRSARSTFVAEVDANEEMILLSARGESTHAPRYRAINNPGIAALVERAILWGQNDKIFRASLEAAGDILDLQKASYAG